MEPKNGKRESDDLALFIKKIGDGIQTKSLDKNKHLKSLMAENKRNLINMLDTSYQDAFIIETDKRRK